MARNLYWLSDDEWSSIQPHLPKGHRGVRRVDDRLKDLQTRYDKRADTFLSAVFLGAAIVWWTN